MKEDVYERIEKTPQFKQLVAKRERFAWLLSIIMLGLYLAFIILIAFEPQLLGTRINPDSPTTWGIPLGVGLILSAFVLTGIYVKRANGEFDALSDKIKKDVLS